MRTRQFGGREDARGVHGDASSLHGSAFDAAVYEVVAAIPAGRVASYGQVAILCGMPGRARRVGAALGNAPQGIPCHRVVNAAGRIAPDWPEQRALLLAEGVGFCENGNVNMKKYRI